MTNIQFQKINEEHRGIISQWFSEDVVGKRFVASYENFSQIINLIDFKNRFFWIVRNSQELVGFLDFEIQNQEFGSIAFYVAPKFRGRGLGQELLKAAFTLPELQQVKFINAGIEEGNIASRRALEKSGFSYVEKDGDKLLIFRRQCR